MDYRILYAPVFTVLEFHLDEAEQVFAQPNSMVSMTAGIRISASMGESELGRGWWTGMKRMLGGESIFRAVFSAKRDDQSLLLAPDNYGDIVPLPVTESAGWFLSRGAYLAHTGPCKLDVKYGGFKSMMAKTGLFLLRVSGSGTVFCQTYGAIVEQNLAADEQFFIDNRYVVAFSETVTFQLVKSSERLRDSLMSGEAFVNRFTGPGRLLYQTRGKPAAGFFGYILSAMT